MLLMSRKVYFNKNIKQLFNIDNKKNIRTISEGSPDHLMLILTFSW